MKLLFITTLALLISCGSQSGRREALSSTATGPTPGVATVISIEDAAGGSGNVVNSQTLVNGAPITLYAVARDAFGDFVRDELVNWNSTTATGYFSNQTGSSTVFTPTGDEEVITINAAHLTLTPDSTGLISVTYDAKNFAGLTLWLRADSLLGQLADNDNVVAWNDVNGSGRNVIALSAGQEPNFTLGAFNDYPALRFSPGNSDGLQSTFTINDIITNTEFTYFIIFSSTSIATDNNTDPSQNNALMIDNSGYFGATLRSSGPLVQSYNFDGATAAAVTRNIGLGSFYLFTSYHEAGELFTQLNGDTATSTLSGNTDNLGGQLTIGGGFAPAGFFDGDIAEIIIYNTSLAPADRLVVQNYLCTKYALTCP